MKVLEMLQDDLRAAAAWLRLPESSEFLTIGTGFKTCDVKRLLDATVVQRDESKGSLPAQTLATHFPDQPLYPKNVRSREFIKCCTCIYGARMRTVACSLSRPW